jgi:hypothetical protein
MKAYYGAAKKNEHFVHVMKKVVNVADFIV